MREYLDVKRVAKFCRENGWGYSAEGTPQPFTEEQFKKIAELMGNVENNPRYRVLFERLAVWIVKTLRPRSALEFGCGPGYLIRCLANFGVDVRGIDGNRFFWTDFQVRHYGIRDYYVLDPLFEKPVRPADIFASIEVFEHIPDEALNRIMTRVRDEVRPRFIVFSSTPFPESTPNWDLQWGHINLKQPEQWQAFFALHGYKLETVKPPVTAWAQLYSRS